MLTSHQKVRELQTQYLGGPKRIPNDEFTEKRDRIIKYGSFLRSFLKNLKTFNDRISQFSQVHSSLLSSKFPALSSVSESFEVNGFMLTEIEKIILGELESVERIEASLVERDKLFWEKQHYEIKIANLTDDEKEDADRIDRNVQKRSRAITNFAETEMKILREAKIFESRINNKSNEIIELFSTFQTKYWSGW